MKKFLLLISTGCLLMSATVSYGQCAAGYTQATLNWDNLDFFIYTGKYTSANGYLSSNALSQTQNFQFGTNRLTINHNIADANSLGENGTHTGETGSYGTGDDINFNANGTITFTFENEVENLKFSIYDLDNSQSATVTAKNAANASVNVNIANANVLSTAVITGSGTTTASVTTALVGNVAVTSNSATVNIDIAGPVKTITLAMGGTAGDFWISDITACTPGSFPTSYYNVSRPFTGMPGYVLHAFDKSVYAVDPATGITKLLFTDPDVSLGSSQFINSMAYDPYNRILYYVYSLTTTPSNNRRLMKYDFNTGTITVLLADINTIGVPTSNKSGVESGAGAFYNGSWYIGVECGDGAQTSGREAVIYRLDFDPVTKIPYRACQVWATPLDNGSGTLMHDWADFTINDGMLYDFDGAGAYKTSAQMDVYQTDMLTGATVNFPSHASVSPAWIPGQPTVDWSGQVYNLHAINPQVLPYVAPYNTSTGNIGTKLNLTSTPMFTPANPSLGDAAEAFRPLCDFGDAPSSYDPVALSPAVNEIDPLLHLGASEDKEWLTRGQTALANSDNFDDALPYVTTFSPYSAAYLIQATVFNNTGSPATLCAWLDYNGNGVFDAAEGKSYTIPTSASSQSVYLYWPLISSTLANGTYTYLRIRITTAAMTTANATGYFPNGETEDYRVPVNNYVLATQLLSFNAMKNGKAVDLQWKTSGDQLGTKYEVERSTNMMDWSSLNVTNGTGTGSNYAYTDGSPLNGTSYYRLRTQNPDGSFSYSKISTIIFNDVLSFTLSPNPASNSVKMSINGDDKRQGSVKVLDIMGRPVYAETVTIEAGLKTFMLPVDRLSNGIYSVQLQVGNKQYIEKLVIKK